MIARGCIILSTLSLIYATSVHATVTKSVDGERFCIPESRFVNVQLPYSQDLLLSDDGFVFQLPVEFLRAKDDRFLFAGGLSTAQLIAIVFVLGGFAWMWWRWDVTPERPGIYAASAAA